MFAPLLPALRPVDPPAPAPDRRAARARFRDRDHAADALAGALSRTLTGGLTGGLTGVGCGPAVVVLGMVRGGVPVARRVAEVLGTPFGVLVTRKIGVPGIEEVALGAVADEGAEVLDGRMAWYLGVPPRVLRRLAAREHAEVARRAALLRGALGLDACRDRIVVLVDDGLASGATLRAAARAVRAHRPRRVVVGVPVASDAGARAVRAEVDALVAVTTVTAFGTVSDWYDDFAPVRTDEVLRALGQAPRLAAAAGSTMRDAILRDVSDQIAPGCALEADASGGAERPVRLRIGALWLPGDVGRPCTPIGADAASERPRGLAVLADGGAGGRDGYRTRFLAGRLRLAGYATLRVDLGAPGEDEGTDPPHAPPASGARSAADAAHRMAAVCDWAVREGLPGAERLVLVGGGGAAAAALATATHRPAGIAAVAAWNVPTGVSSDDVARVPVPTLLVAGHDARSTLPGGARRVFIPHAGPAFDAPGALGAAAERVVAWLERLDRPRRHPADARAGRATIHPHIARLLRGVRSSLLVTMPIAPDPAATVATAARAPTTVVSAGRTSVGAADVRHAVAGVGDSLTVRVTPVRGTVYVADSPDGSAGGNVAASVGPDGILLVDDMLAATVPALRRALAAVSPAPVRLVLTTHYHADHAGGNAAFGATAVVVATEPALLRARAAGAAPYPAVTYDREIRVRFNGEEVRARHVPSAHTDGDAIVYFAGSRVLHLGDLYFAGMFPAVYRAGGGDVRQLITVLEGVLAEYPPDTRVVPGHGPVSSMDDLRAYVAMLRETVAAVDAGLRRHASAATLRDDPALRRYAALGDGGAQTLDQYVAMLVSLLSAAPATATPATPAPGTVAPVTAPPVRASAPSPTRQP